MVSRNMPLRECDFSPKIQRCYFSAKEFYCELNMEETLEVFKVFDDCPAACETADVGPSQSSSAILSPRGFGLLGSPMLALPAKDIGSTHNTLSGEGLKRKEIDTIGTQMNRGLDFYTTHDSVSLAPVSTSMNKGKDSEVDKEIMVHSRKENHLHSSNLDTVAVVAIQQQPEGEPKNLPMSLGSKVENKHFQDNAGFGANCLPVLFGNQVVNEVNAVDSHQVDSVVDDRMSNASFGQALYPPIGMHSMPTSSSPGASNENHEALDDASNLRQEIQKCTMEILQLKEECKKVRSEEMIDKNYTGKLEATLESQMASRSKLMDDLHQLKMDNKKLREQNSEFASTLKASKAELAEAQEGLRTARKVQETLLKIQNETMDEMDRKRNEYLELRVKYQEVLATNKFLQAKLDRLLAATEQEFPRLRGLKDLHDTSHQGAGSRESTKTVFQTSGNHYGTKDQSDIHCSAFREPGERKDPDSMHQSQRNLHATDTQSPSFGAIASRPQVEASFFNNGGHISEDSCHKQPRVACYPPGLSLSSAPCTDKDNEIGTPQSIGKKYLDTELRSHSNLDQKLNAPSIPTTFCSNKHDTYSSYMAQSFDHAAELHGVQDAGLVSCSPHVLEIGLSGNAPISESVVFPKPQSSGQHWCNAPNSRTSSLRTRDDCESVSSRQENKKRQKRDFSSMSLPVPATGQSSMKVDEPILQPSPKSGVPSTLAESSEICPTTITATSNESQAMQLPIPALLQSPIPPAPVPTIVEATKRIIEPPSNISGKNSSVSTNAKQTTSGSHFSLPLPCMSPTTSEEKDKPVGTGSAALSLNSTNATEVLPIPELEISLPEKCRDSEISNNNSASKSISVHLPVPHVLPDEHGNLDLPLHEDKQEKDPRETLDEELSSGIKCDAQKDHLASMVRSENKNSDLISESVDKIEKPNSLDVHHDLFSNEDALLLFGGKNETEIDLGMVSTVWQT